MAMTKIIDPRGWDFDRPVAQMIKVSSRGLIGADRRDFLKYASAAFLPFIDGIKIAKDEVPVHHIALGATEAYGPNRNGDGFKEANCRKYHHTFVKSARLYRNHANKDPKNSFGHVKLSAYNDDMRRVELLAIYNATKDACDRNGGHVADKEIEKLAKGEDLPGSMACVTDPTYPVLTKERGYIGIADVVAGNYVWTHNGRWRRVKSLNRRVYTGEVLTFAVNGLPLPLELTADHPMFAKVFTGSRELAAVKAKARRFFKDKAAFDSEPAGWQHAAHIGVGDRFFYKPIARYDGFGRIDDNDLAAIMGYYLAEGSFGYNGDKAAVTQFTCNLSDSLPRRLPGLVQRMYPDITVNIKPHRNSQHALIVEVSSTEFSEYLRRFVGIGCKNKMIAPEIFNACDEVKLAYLGAWHDGDGWCDAKGVHWSTTSQNLSLQGRDLLASIGIASSIYMIDHEKCATSGYDGSGVEYSLNISYLDAWRLTGYSQKVTDFKPPEIRRMPACMRVCHDGTYAYRIKRVERRFVSAVETYNFEVEEDESYSLGGFISHNCRVPEDVCSSCGNHARTRDEYCTKTSCVGPRGEKRGGCRDSLTKIADDGHILHVDNPDPHWFDYSYVFRPADRIAYGAKADYLQKAASHGFEPGAQLADSLGVSAPLHVCLDQDVPETWDPELRAHVKLAMALAVAEVAPLLLHPATFRTFDPDTQSMMTEQQIGLLGQPGTEKCGSALSLLADNLIVLGLPAFARWVGMDAHTKAAAMLLPAVYQHLATSNGLENRVTSNPFACLTKTASTSQRLLVASLKSAYSLNTDAVSERAMRSALKTAEAPVPKLGFWNEKLASEQPAAVKLVELYGMYKLAALCRIASYDRNFHLTARLAIGQNKVV